MTASTGHAVRADNLALIFQEVLTAIVRLRSNRQELTDAETFRYSMREAIKTAIQEARNQAGYSAEDIKMATLALVGFLDESVLNTQNPIFAEWPRKPLQEELFGIHMAGELFFQNLSQLLGRQDSADLADLLEIHYLCLLLGYSGRYSLGGGGELSQANATAPTKITSMIAAAHCQVNLRAGPVTATTFPEIVSRLIRFKSACNSAALWKRTSRSFSKALLMMRSNSAGSSASRRVAGVGVAPAGSLLSAGGTSFAESLSTKIGAVVGSSSRTEAINR